MLVSTEIDRTEAPVLAPGRMVDLPGRGAVFVRDTGPRGDAPTVVLLHGWSATADLNWHPYFSSLSRHFRVVALDQRGHGRGLRSDEPFRLEDCADDVAALAHVLGVDGLIVVGYSMGGAVAQLLWRRHRSLVDGLVFCSTSAMFRSNRRLRVLFGAAAAAHVVGGVPKFGSAANSVFVRATHWHRRQGRSPWGLAEIARHDWQQVIEAGHQVGRYDGRSWVSDIDAPTSVIVTTADEVVPTRHQLALARSIPGATLHRVSGGHHHCVTDPDRYRPVLLEACRATAAAAHLESSSVAA